MKVDLPKVASQPNLTLPEHIAISIDAAGAVFWSGERVDRVELRRRLAASQREPKPDIHLRADKATPYQALAEVMADAAKAGMNRIGFVSDPNEAN